MYQNILVPVDGSATSLQGLEQAIAMARLANGRIRLMHVVDELSFALATDAYAGYVGDWMSVLRENGAKLLQECLQKVEAADISVDTVLRDNLDGSVHELVTKEAATWPADLIVLGTHGRRGAKRLFLGSSAESILRTATVPVLLVRASEGSAPDETKRAAECEPVRVHLPAGALAIE
ncbi:universal stress protein [Variovorax sp. Sphag1AA]|uniref:universal stress protein n=1 Tax=Variovorax sp. Sphag1AA TaxID=2587027 RepID=UPI0016129BD9|nr:universal stress protein [Variovorax sp. Sphag1AA]MBB3176810.1 nucleotide-binding universal stress UspA family protein [Variovorax sp. Sphag1AA]MBO9651418.1 universal stress protein [Variovorax sp.]